MREPDFTLWRRIPLHIGPDYDYLRRGVFKTMLYGIIYTAAAALLRIFNFVLFGTRLRGRKNLRGLRKQGLVVTCNHVHWLDCSMVGAFLWPRRAYFITLQSNLELPVIRHLVRILGGIPIPRERRRMPEFHEAVLRVLREGAAVPIYPEGELHPYADCLYPLKKTAFSLAYDAGVPVLPVCITYRRGKGFFRFKKRPCLTVHALKPIFPDRSRNRRDEVEALCREVAAQMQLCMEESKKSPALPK
ncbi:MAG: 1-acyl-sn-glycerol-3-phosphate acyltransferase [Clostridiaceae bacterium]|nr:1-acyl-sn-glycerol-3-phosphate acyltransferase [Clostridiaceae bacterium]